MVGTVKRYLKMLWLALCVVGGALALLWAVMINKRKERYDTEADHALDEARRVREAAERGDDDAVLDSFGRATKK